MRSSTLRPLLLPAAAAMGLTLLGGLPVLAHGPADAGIGSGFAHPITGLDHIMLLVAVGAVAACSSRAVLLFAVAGALLGAMAGAFGGGLPASELLAALAISALGLVILSGRRSGPSPRLGLIGTLVAMAVAIHALLHGQEASGTVSWWLGAALGSALVVAVSYGALRLAPVRWSKLVAGLLTVAGLVLAIAPAITAA